MTIDGLLIKFASFTYDGLVNTPVASIACDSEARISTVSEKALAVLCKCSVWRWRFDRGLRISIGEIVLKEWWKQAIPMR